MEYVPTKTIVTKTKDSRWFGIDYNMNIYRGCSHGCIYSDSRSDCYRVDHFDTVKAKEDALRIIRDDLRRKVRTGVVGTGAMSDPYNPFEKDLLLTRHALELIDAFGMTLRNNQKEWYFDRLDELFPEDNLPERYMKRYGNRYECHSPRAKQLWNLFTGECEKYGILYDMKDIVHSYKKAYQMTQLSLFD